MAKQGAWFTHTDEFKGRICVRQKAGGWAVIRQADHLRPEVPAAGFCTLAHGDEPATDTEPVDALEMYDKGVNDGIRLAAQMVRGHVLGSKGENIARFLEVRADRKMESTGNNHCLCATVNGKKRCEDG